MRSLSRPTVFAKTHVENSSIYTVTIDRGEGSGPVKGWEGSGPAKGKTAPCIPRIRFQGQLIKVHWLTPPSESQNVLTLNKVECVMGDESRPAVNGRVQLSDNTEFENPASGAAGVLLVGASDDGEDGEKHELILDGFAGSGSSKPEQFGITIPLASIGYKEVSSLLLFCPF